MNTCIGGGVAAVESLKLAAFSAALIQRRNLISAFGCKCRVRSSVAYKL